MTTYITKTWFDGEKVVTQEIPESEIYKQEQEQPEQGQWDAIPDAFNEWWNADYDDSTNPFRLNSPAYWAWAGWSAANKFDAQSQRDWSLLEATQESLREHMAEIKLLKQRSWIGLTDDERRNIMEWQKIQDELGPVWAPMMLYLYLAIEAKLKEKNR